jgi:hypothetical protein
MRSQSNGEEECPIRELPGCAPPPIRGSRQDSAFGHGVFDSGLVRDSIFGPAVFRHNDFEPGVFRHTVGNTRARSLVRQQVKYLWWPVGWFPVLVFALVVAAGG